MEDDDDGRSGCTRKKQREEGTELSSSRAKSSAYRGRSSSDHRGRWGAALLQRQRRSSPATAERNTGSDMADAEVRAAGFAVQCRPKWKQRGGSRGGGGAGMEGEVVELHAEGEVLSTVHAFLPRRPTSAVARRREQVNTGSRHWLSALAPLLLQRVKCKVSVRLHANNRVLPWHTITPNSAPNYD